MLPFLMLLTVATIDRVGDPERGFEALEMTGVGDPELGSEALVIACEASSETITEAFIAPNTTLWTIADGQYVSQFAPVYYLANHSRFGVALSQQEGEGLQLLISPEPCAYNPPALCQGAAMASGHLSTTRLHGFGDYIARLRAPHNFPGNGSKCSDGVYGYFTAGYVHSECGLWNEINFGFHPDRDEGGHRVSLELHADSGGYHEASVDVGFNYREGFHTYRIKHRPCDVSWWVDGRCVHVMKECLTQPMHTSLILRTNQDGELPSAKMEFAAFNFTPFVHDGVAPRPPAKGASVEELIAWHHAHPEF